MRSKIFVLVVALGTTLISCNPFAPSYDEEGLLTKNLLGDRNTIDGLFVYFKNAYELRDTSIYSQLFTDDFTFTYFDFDQNANVNWDKGEEMALTWNLFRSVNTITLDWNFYVQKDSLDELNAQVIRAFNLTIVEDENTIHQSAGRARLNLRRNVPTDPWQISYWFDDSDF